MHAFAVPCHSCEWCLVSAQALRMKELLGEGGHCFELITVVGMALCEIQTFKILIKNCNGDWKTSLKGRVICLVIGGKWCPVS